MKCLVCGMEFSAAACPRCGFPVVESPNIDALMGQVEESVVSWRETFYRELELSVAVQKWEEQDGKIVPGEKEYRKICCFADMQEEPVYYPGYFSRIPDARRLTVEMRASCEKTQWETIFRVSIPNIRVPGLQRLSLTKEGAGSCRLHLSVAEDGEEAPASDSEEITIL